MKEKIASLVLIALSLTLCNTLYAEQLDKIVAVINDDIVTQTELNHALTIARAQIAQQQLSEPAPEVLRKQTLDQLINKKLELQIAKQAGVTISDTEMDRIIERVASQNNISVSELYQRISQDGLSTEDYRDTMHDQMTIQKLQQQEVGNRIAITPTEIDSFLKSHLKTQPVETEKAYHVEDVLVPLSEAPTIDEITRAKSEADAIVSHFKQTKLFDVPNKVDLGWMKKEEAPTVFAPILSTMQKNDVSEPIQASNGFHILYLVDVRSLSSPNQALPNRSQVEALLMQRKFEDQVERWLSRMKSQAFIVKNFTS